MKKKLFVFIFCTLSITIILFLNSDKVTETSVGVSSIVDENTVEYVNNDFDNLIIKEYDFNNFYLLFDVYKINFKNIEGLVSFFSKNNYEYKINSIYPYLNPLYEEKLKDIYEISFNGKDLQDGLNNFYKSYLNELIINHLDEELNKARIGQINIRMISINTSNIAMYNFLKHYNQIRYSLLDNGSFKTLQ